MVRKEIQTRQAPQAIGPYSQAIEAGGFVYVSGQIPIDPATGNVVEGIEQQTHQVMNNLQAVLEAAELSFANVVKFTIYITSMDDFAKVNEVYAGYLEQPYPARATVEVSRLPKGVAIEMDVVAVKG
ncbi:RidA family protein [Sediminibacillus massiliensis]|uniref:RidA family protein n=1 Tax=Sediminibacillus massiliensis TaxID=1926277 RepID=UPI000988921A|nr:RidA family protein [Sediminibacillus massiliensis]